MPVGSARPSPRSRVGLLHDLGSALLRRHDPERYHLVQEVAAGREHALLRREARAYGDLCAQVLASWHVPPTCARCSPAATTPPTARRRRLSRRVREEGGGTAALHVR